MAGTDPPTPRDGGRLSDLSSPDALDLCDVDPDDPDDYLGAAPDPAGLYVGASHPATRTVEMPARWDGVFHLHSDGVRREYPEVRSTPAVRATPRERPGPAALAVVEALEAARTPSELDEDTLYDTLQTLADAVRQSGATLAGLAAFLDLAERAGMDRVSVAAVREALR